METLNYLNNGHGLKSWLLTKDHKRIAIMYLISISVMFLLGGLFMNFSWIIGAAPNDHLRDVDQGEGTFLNTREWKYASYFNRIKQQVASSGGPQRNTSTFHRSSG